jgi:vacuolar-type H+-ATPase subunit C/Vma6
MEAYNRSHDVFPLLSALEHDYYAHLLESARFYQGDEWVIRQFLQDEIDLRNVLLVLKGLDAGLPLEPVQERFLDGGTLPRSTLPELYNARSVGEIVTTLEPKFPALPEGLDLYNTERTLTGFETALLRERAVQQLKRMRSYPLSLAILFTYLMVSELERADLRRITYGKLYGVAESSIQAQLVGPKL